MTEQTTPSTDQGDVDPSVPRHFEMNVQIGELPYVLDGDLPDEPTDIVLTVSLPDRVWQTVKPEIEEKESRDDWFAVRYHTLQQTGQGDGRVGSVIVSPEDAPDGAPSIHVNNIETDNRYLPDDNPYHDAKGVGSFILDNLCALADARGWRIYLTPLERDGRLTGRELNAWYERRGFKFDEDDALSHLYEGTDEMMRLPQEPDTTQPILQALSPAA